MIETIRKHKPIILGEFFEREERIRLLEVLAPLGYQLFRLTAGQWHPEDGYAEGPIVSQNNYFIPPAQRETLKSLIAHS
jgi:hypothetical protein